ncbi:LysR substrate-binding domain-containing protein [Shewanella colwelliana]|uniref:LysR family transcriptional regulator n=1 Tax=Shewanella colwelliana TaxID=23 RepID=A0A1E5IRG5_SHECO|nr:LysR substrate-binding domain-containing protein [Shewanella colwelliana]MCZ4336001.1 LysR substrate-binding domain-containing protein [Shewanella colwelliana]MDX1279717.1 LysR substrate-binding domain-containing protein [Shewanella colwelliana]OEG72588.1 LysR family transcriptional regulator [Shewanella colwelliana]GIU21105.1 LysR family transcriptional regulator [Shewanella colwelliana]GIU45573.1 LysR family transcriptional regulator [Shewanella colwelliana]
MDLKALHYLVEIVKCGGFNRAAAKIHISQPALSKAINQLEAELELPLLTRGKRGTSVALTVHGQLVYDYAVRLLDTKQAMFNELNQLRGLETGQLKLGLAPLGSAELFAPIIAKFRQRHPKINTQLLVRGGVEQTSALQQGEIELATGIIELGNEFEGIAIHTEPMVVVLPAQHELAQRQEIPLSALNHCSQILFEAEFSLHEMVINACEQADVIIDNPTQVNQPEFGIALVASGIGVMLLPRFIAERYQIEGVVTRALTETRLSWKMSLFWVKDKPLSFAALTMIEIVKQHLKR